MTVYEIVSAIVVGAAAGLLARLILPRRHRVGAFAALVVGVAAGFLGFFAARFAGADHHPARVGPVHWDWMVLALQVGIAVVGVALAGALTPARAVGDKKPGSRRAAANRRRRNSPTGTCA